MGYRVLLKRYMQELRRTTGTDYVQQIIDAETLSKREVGELRSIAAELTRETILRQYEERQD